MLVVVLVVLLVDCIVAIDDTALVDVSEVELVVVVEGLAGVKSCETSSTETLEVAISVEVCSWLLSTSCISSRGVDEENTIEGSSKVSSTDEVVRSRVDNSTKALTKSAR